MKITKTVKYDFKLTGENLEEDINLFIKESKKGRYDWDYKYNMEGLRIIKEYFKILQKKFDNSEFEECKDCYYKLILFLFAASTGRDMANFGYEDLLARTKLDWDKIIRNYFLCLVKTCDLEELSEKISEYAIALKEYGFDSDAKILLEQLDKQTLENLEQRILIKTEGMTKKEEDKHDIIYFLMKIAEEQDDKEKYNKLCGRFEGVLDKKELEYLKNEFNENEIWGEGDD